jgi:hypothetical protein
VPDVPDAEPAPTEPVVPDAERSAAATEGVDGTAVADATQDGDASGADASTRHGAGRVLITVYAILAIGSTARAAYELLTKFSHAPLSYALSAFAAVVYCVITVALIRDTPRWRRVALVGMVVELVGVLVIGTWSVFDKAAFTNPETGKVVSSVWYWYGRDYLFIPLVLPVLGLRFLYRTRAVPADPA